VPDPVLHTERLTLRPLTAERAAALLDAPPVDGFPTDDDAQVLRGVVASGADAHGSFVVEQGGRPVGTAGAAGGLSPDGDQEIGYGLVPDARRQGLGTEAVGALCAYLESRPGVRRLTAEVRPGNAGSLRLLRTLGFAAVDGGTGGHQLLARAAPGEPAVRARIPGRHVC
jgi:RimJ/RimL family protein N-acetyltransferase